ncbi:MAG: helix-turn-helix domain-containing protein [Hungatella hathewayi]|uniref:helix-turn-helix domain-containing protein n=1 Tax=Hungatella hathewayi TaxID=154046 RepID=UPI00243527CE|nr:MULTISPECIES: helix-turn-helix domain-containing protein [Hungatella]MDY6235523.1 helix-turn-helix domain-containing protein [Hungatella hathewayi]
MRMKRARELLTHFPEMKMTDIAAEIGLGDNPQYFSQLFKKYEGITPSQFSSAPGQEES